MKTITITQRNGTVHEVLIDDDAPDEVFTKKWSIAKSNTGNNKFYAIRTSNGKTIYMHRIILDCPPDMQIDHRNNIGTDNRKENLRIATHSQNNANSKGKRVNNSGFKGVYFNIRYGSWRASIKKNSKTINIGTFKTAEEAHAAYCKKGKELFGEFFNAG